MDQTTSRTGRIVKQKTMIGINWNRTGARGERKSLERTEWINLRVQIVRVVGRETTTGRDGKQQGTKGLRRARKALNGSVYSQEGGGGERETQERREGISTQSTCKEVKRQKTITETDNDKTRRDKRDRGRIDRLYSFTFLTHSFSSYSVPLNLQPIRL